MCEFLSGIAQRNGDVIALPEATHSHSDLIRYLGLKDENPELRQWVRVEFSPSQASDLDEVDKYKLKLDDFHPVWWDDVQETVEKNMRRMVTQIIVAEDRDILLGGFWIVGKGIKVNVAKNVRIYAMLDSSQVGKMWDSSQVGEMWGSSQVGEMWGSSQVGKMCCLSQVGEMCGSSQVGEMLDSSQVRSDSRLKKVKAKNSVTVAASK